jgi:hypothetical protein
MNKEMRIKSSQNAKYTIMHNNNTEYIISPERTLKGNCAASQRGLFYSSPFRSHGTRENQAGGWTSKEATKELNTKLAQGGPSGSSPLRTDSSCDSQAGGWTY